MPNPRKPSRPPGLFLVKISIDFVHRRGGDNCKIYYTYVRPSENKRKIGTGTKGLIRQKSAMTNEIKTIDAKRDFVGNKFSNVTINDVIIIAKKILATYLVPNQMQTIENLEPNKYRDIIDDSFTIFCLS
jgi:hypothetical protein